MTAEPVEVEYARRTDRPSEANHREETTMTVTTELEALLRARGRRLLSFRPPDPLVCARKMLAEKGGNTDGRE
jgi:hypothetical protein